MNILKFTMMIENDLGERFTISDANAMVQKWSLDVGEMGPSGFCVYTVGVTAYGNPHGVEKLFGNEALHGK